MTVGLCLLVFNELEGCRKTVPLIDRGRFDEVFAIDGGSSDGTVEYLLEQGVEVRRQPVKGYNAAYHHAFSTSSSDVLVFFHPKGTIDTAQTLLFRDYFSRGFDLVIASRIMKGAVNEEDQQFFKPRKWFVVGLGLLVSLVWRRGGPRITDVLHGFRGISRKAFTAIDPLHHGLSMDVEMVVRSYKFNLKRVEFPIHERSREFGETHFKPFPTATRILGYLWFEFFRKG